MRRSNGRFRSAQKSPIQRQAKAVRRSAANCFRNCPMAANYDFGSPSARSKKGCRDRPPFGWLISAWLDKRNRGQTERLARTGARCRGSSADFVNSPAAFAIGSLRLPNRKPFCSENRTHSAYQKPDYLPGLHPLVALLIAHRRELLAWEPGWSGC